MNECRACSGTGINVDSDARPNTPCSVCNGTGTQEINTERPYHELARYRTLTDDACKLAAFIGHKQADGRPMTEASETLRIAAANLECYARFDWLYPSEFLDDAFRALARGWQFARAS
jgi:hypothetical protein